MITIKKISLILFASGILLSNCKKKDVPPTTASLTTTAVTSITANTAVSGGTISSNGGADITASGIAWSKTNTTPTITDDTTKGTTSSGSFTANLKNLISSSTYYVRAYAINSAGIGYGNVVTFTTGNAAPVATAVTIIGLAEVNRTLTATYTYTDAESDAQSGSTFQWYVANDAAGTGETAIAGATALTYIIQVTEQNKYIRFGVTPKAATGTTTGAEVKSAFIGGIGEATTVTFTYNGASVTYGILTSAATGRKWLDRNLGAPSVATSVNNYQNYGDLFQWGRLADGHQIINRTGPNDADATGVNGTTSAVAPFELSTSDVPGHPKFIRVPGTSVTGGEGFDWRTPQNNNLWQGANSINNPCPSGWHVPTQGEWAAENITSITDGYNKLKITFTGFRSGSTAAFLSSTVGGFYSTSTIGPDLDGNPEYSIRIRFDASSYSGLGVIRGSAYACRCIKN